MSNATTTKPTARQASSTRPTSARNAGSKAATPTAPVTEPTLESAEELTIEELKVLLAQIQLDLAALSDNDPQSARASVEAVALTRRLIEAEARSRKSDVELSIAGYHDMTKLRLRVTDFVTEQSERMADIEAVNDVQDGRLTEHDTKFKLTDKMFKIHDTRITDVEAMMQISVRTLAIGLVVAVVVWIIAGILWGSHDFSPAAIILTDGTQIKQSSPLDEAWAAILFGLIPAVIVFIPFILFSRKRVRENEEKAVVVNESKSDESPKDKSDANNTPTKPYRANAGADSPRS